MRHMLMLSERIVRGGGEYRAAWHGDVGRYTFGQIISQLKRAGVEYPGVPMAEWYEQSNRDQCIVEMNDFLDKRRQKFLRHKRRHEKATSRQVTGGIASPEIRQPKPASESKIALSVFFCLLAALLLIAAVLWLKARHST